MHKLILSAIFLVQLCPIVNAQTTVQFTPSQDNSIFSELPSNSNGAGELFSGEICNTGHRRSLMQFDLTSLPCGATVTSVTLTLVVDMVPPNVTTTNYTLNKLLTAWGEGTSSGSGQGAPAIAPDATWNDAKFGTNQWTTAGGDFNAASATTTMTAGTGTQTFSSTATLVSDVQSWISNPSANFGWILIGNEAIVCTARRLGSKEIGTAPVLQVTYTIPSASFNYSASSYCVNASDPTPTITGTPGGTFSSTPAGLSINTNSGTIDVSASTPAAYTVTYTAPGNCSISTNQSVTINALSNASFNYGAASYCANAADPTPTITGLAGGTFSSTAGLSLNSSTGKITLSTSTPATYNVTYSVTGTCPNSVSHSVTINALSNASFNYGAASYCVNAADPTPTITGLAGGTFSSTPPGLSLNSFTGKITLNTSIPGVYNVTYSVGGTCPNLVVHSVTINALSNASFNYGAASYCVNGTDPTPTITGLAGGTFSSAPAGLSLNTSTGKITLSTSTPATYNVTYSVIGTCPNSVSHSVTITSTGNSSFNYSGASYCVNGSDPTPTITGQAGGTFSSAPAGLSLNTSTGKITLNTSTPATYNVTYSVTGTCPSSTSHSVTINSASNASFSYGSPSYCVNVADPTPTITGLAGGIFSSAPAGLILNTSTGKITLLTSNPGIYNVTYAVTGTCPNSVSHSVTINALSNANFNYSSASYCLSSADPTPSITGLAGGTFTSSPAGLIINVSTGTIDVSASTTGTYTVTYSVTGACPNSSSKTITITSAGNSSFNYSSASYCVNDSDPTPTITGLSGGTFSGVPAGIVINPGTGIIDVSATTPGAYTITYSVTGTCPSSSTQSVTINNLSNANFSYGFTTYCANASNPTPIVTGQPGGKFTSAPPGMIVDSVSGIINLGASIPGIYTITYTTTGTCPNSSSQSVAIVNGNAGFNYGSSSYCRNSADPTPVITGDTTGKFSSAPTGLIIDSVTGTIDVSLTAIGTYLVTYKTTGLCPDSTSQSVTINNSGNADFSYSVDTFCTNASNPSPIISGQSGGTFTASPSGIVLDSVTGIIDLGLSTQGIYTVTYTISGVCSSVSAQPVTINPASNADFSYSSTSYCDYGGDETPLITGLAGGYFTSSPTGLVLDSMTGKIQVNASIAGTYNVMYTTIASCPNSAIQPFTITSIDTSLTLNLHTLTANDSNATYQWVICPSLSSIAGEINQSFTPTTGGNYAVILSTSGCVDTSNCYIIIFVSIDENSAYDNINIFPNPTHGEVSVQLKYFYETIDVTVNDILGNKIDAVNFSSTNKFQFHLNASSGIYFLNIQTNTGQHYKLKLIKE